MSEVTLTEPQRKAAVNAIVNKHAAGVAAEAAEAAEDNTAKMKATASLLALGGQSSGDLQQQVLLELLKSLQSDAAEKKAKKDAELEERNRLHLAMVTGLRENQKQEKYTQSVCPHTKENGKTRIGGQKLSNNHYAFMCNFCHKEFDENTLPPHLHPGLDTIGG